MANECPKCLSQLYTRRDRVTVGYCTTCPNCLDGAPDASAFAQLTGRGKTDEAALADWWEQYEELGE